MNRQIPKEDEKNAHPDKQTESPKKSKWNWILIGSIIAIILIVALGLYFLYKQYQNNEKRYNIITDKLKNIEEKYDKKLSEFEDNLYTNPSHQLQNKQYTDYNDIQQYNSRPSTNQQYNPQGFVIHQQSNSQQQYNPQEFMTHQQYNPQPSSNQSQYNPQQSLNQSQYNPQQSLNQSQYNPQQSLNQSQYNPQQSSNQSRYDQQQSSNQPQYNQQPSNIQHDTQKFTNVKLNTQQTNIQHNGQQNKLSSVNQKTKQKTHNEIKQNNLYEDNPYVKEAKIKGNKKKSQKMTDDQIDNLINS
jgi:hypothetical protein